MTHIRRGLIGLMLYLGLVYACRQAPEPVTAPAGTGGAIAGGGADFFPGHGLGEDDRRSYAEKLEARQRDLKVREERLERRRRAEARCEMARLHLHKPIVPVWEALIRTNLQAFSRLKEEARRSGDGQVPCTLCDGFSYMPCVLCADGGGRCVACEGSGQASAGELCGACIGTGDCHLCTGWGKMLCPFCDDGMVLAEQPDPVMTPTVH